MIQLAVLPLALTLSAAAPALDTSVEQASVETVQDEGGEASATVEDPGFFAKYIPFTFNENLEPETEENFVLLYLSGVMGLYFVAGGIWLPMVTAGAPNEWLVDSIISNVIHQILWFPCVPIQGAINALYLNPVAQVNIWDLNLKQAKKAGTWKAATNVVRPPSASELALATPSMAF